MNLNDEDEVIVDTAMRTNVPGIFAAGDLTNASGDLKADHHRCRPGSHRGLSRLQVHHGTPCSMPMARRGTIPQEEAVTA